MLTATSSYGFLNQFRPLPLIPSQVYRLDPTTRRVRVVADGFDKPNGIAFSEDGKTAYMYVPSSLAPSYAHPLSYSADTGSDAGFLGNNQTEPATMYAVAVTPCQCTADMELATLSMLTQRPKHS